MGSLSCPLLFQALQQAELYCRAQGLPFPRVELSPEDQCQPKECHIFSDPTCPEAPVLLHFPLVNVSFKDYSAPGETAPLLPARQPGPWRPCPRPSPVTKAEGRKSALKRLRDLDRYLWP